MIDPNTVVIQGDLSRADAAVLLELCQGKKVVEFGVGGSTLLIARVAASLTSYDTDKVWLDRTQKRLKKLTTDCVVSLNLIHAVPDTIPECDVLFIDGLGDHRPKWLKFFSSCKVMICHDSLGDTGTNGPTLYNIMSDLFKDRNHIENLDRADFHYKNSNMVVVYRRKEPIKYVNWNILEVENRISPYAID